MSDNNLRQVISRVSSIAPSSRDDMKQLISDALNGYEFKMIDSHNTAPVLYMVSTDEGRFMIKAEYGKQKKNTVSKEITWYQRAKTALLHPDLVGKHSNAQFSMLVLSYIEDALTLDQLAEADSSEETASSVANLTLKAIEMDRLLFSSSGPINAAREEVDQFYEEKYQMRTAEAKEYDYLKDLLEAPAHTVNGLVLHSPGHYMEQIQHSEALRNYLTPDQLGLIHGDLHFGNILLQQSRLYFVDPNGESRMPIEYDYGKILHSFHGGYNQIAKGQFLLQKNDDGYRFKIEMPESYTKVLSATQQHFTEQEYMRGLYSEALHFATMLPHHASNEVETTALFLRCMQIFQELFDHVGKLKVVG